MRKRPFHQRLPAQDFQAAPVGPLRFQGPVRAGTVLGPILGSFILSPLAELARLYFAQSGWHGAHLVAYGLLLIAVVLFLPEGAYPRLARLFRRRAPQTP